MKTKGNAPVGILARLTTKPAGKGELQSGIQRKRSRSEIAIQGEFTKPRVIFPERINNRTYALEISLQSLPEVTDNDRLFEVGEGCLREMLLAEEEYSPDPDYLPRQSQLNTKMRAVLLDWMFEVGFQYGLKRETLHSAINFVDRYLSRQHVPRQNLQLVGTTSLWLASKMEEILPPPVSDFAAATDGACTSLQIIEMEGGMVQALDWKLLPCTAFSFANYYLQQIAIKAKTKLGEDIGSDNRSWMLPNVVSTAQLNRIMELIDLAVLDIDCLCFSPSVLSATAILTIVERAKSNVLTAEDVLQVTKFAREDLKDCLQWFEFAPELPPADPTYPPHVLQSNLESELHLIQRHHPTALRYYKDLSAARPQGRHAAADRMLQKRRQPVNSSDESEDELERITMQDNKRHNSVIALDSTRSFSPMTQLQITFETNFST